MTDAPTPPDYSDPKILAELRARQRSRAAVMAAILIAMCVLFYAITIVKIGTAS